MTLEPSKSGNRLKLNRSIMASVLTPLLRKLIQKFCEYDRNAMIELRLTILVSHVFNDDAASNHLLPSSTPPTSSDDHPNGKLHQNRSSKTSISSSLSSSHRIWGNGLWQTSSSATASNKPTSSPTTASDEALFYDLYQIWVFGEYMPEIPAPPIIVDLIHAERHNPTVKHVDWTSERKALSKQGTEGANEMIMMDSETRIYEGLSSNFMAVYRDGSVHTAPDSTVLSGTIRNLMLRCAKEEGVVVKMECPRFDEVDQWSAACVMSTSRLLLPIHKLNLLQPIKETMGKDESRDAEIKLDLLPSHSSSSSPSHHHVPIISTFATPVTPVAPHGLVSLNGTKGMEGGSLPPVFTLPSSPSPPQTVGLNGSSSPQHPSSPQPALQNQQEHQHVPSIVRSDSSCSLSDSSASLGSVSSTASHVTSSSCDSTSNSAKIPPHHVASQHEFMEENPTVVKLMQAITSKMRLSSTSVQVQ
jgi:hypothetical protein